MLSIPVDLNRLPFLAARNSTSLRPLPKQSHKPSTEEDADYHKHEAPIASGSQWIEQEISCQQLYQAGVEENAC